VTQYKKQTEDKSSPWQPGTIGATLKRRKELAGATARAVELRLSLDELEERFGFSSTIAMLRIRGGVLQMPAWERMYTEYREIIRWKR
jgi:hypothetical protein